MGAAHRSNECNVTSMQEHFNCVGVTLETYMDLTDVMVVSFIRLLLSVLLRRMFMLINICICTEYMSVTVSVPMLFVFFHILLHSLVVVLDFDSVISLLCFKASGWCGVRLWL